MTDPTDLDAILDAVRREVEAATRKFPELNSPHEGYAVILEELDELWDVVRANDGRIHQYEEAKQVAAMAVRYMLDLTGALEATVHQARTDEALLRLERRASDE